MDTQQIIEALDEAGRLMAPILQNEAIKAGNLGYDVPSIAVTMGGTFTCHCFIGRDRTDRLLSAHGKGETASAAFLDMLAKRSDMLAELEREQAEAAAFEEWKRQREQVAA